MCTPPTISHIISFIVIRTVARLLNSDAKTHNIFNFSALFLVDTFDPVQDAEMVVNRRGRWRRDNIYYPMPMIIE